MVSMRLTSPTAGPITVKLSWLRAPLLPCLTLQGWRAGSSSLTGRPAACRSADSLAMRLMHDSRRSVPDAVDGSDQRHGEPPHICCTRLFRAGAGHGSNTLSTRRPSLMVGSHGNCVGFTPDAGRELDGARTGKHDPKPSSRALQNYFPRTYLRRVCRYLRR